MLDYTTINNLRLLARNHGVEYGQPAYKTQLHQHIRMLPSGTYQIAKTLVPGSKRVVARGKTFDACYRSAIKFIERYNVPFYDY